MSDLAAARRIWEEAIGLRVLVRLTEGRSLDISSPLDEEIELPRSFVVDLHRHKDDLIDLLTYMERADALLLEATRDLGRRWHPGLDLDSEDYLVVEHALNEAYWSFDLRILAAALAERDIVFNRLSERSLSQNPHKSQKDNEET